MKTLRILAGLVLVIGVALGIALRVTRPDPLPVGTQSAARLAPGPHPVERTEHLDRLDAPNRFEWEFRGCSRSKARCRLVVAGRCKGTPATRRLQPWLHVDS